MKRRETKKVFYPICLGEVFDGRYLVEHKLGFGGGSTVWMAHDLQEGKDVALKVIEIAENARDTSYLVISQATFTFSGNGVEHYVLVLPLMGPRINWHTLVNISMAMRMSAARQLLEGLENLHTAGIVHRDVSDGNCMCGMTSLAHFDRSEKYKELGRPLRELVSAIKIPDHLRTDDFYLGDFGLSKRLDEPETQRGYPDLKFCSPDRLHGKDPSAACDIWSYMVVFSVLYFDFALFGSFIGGVISDHVRCLGPLPKEWKGSYTHPGGRESWYDQNHKPDPKHDLAAKFAMRRGDVDPIERGHVVSIMSKAFIYDATKRPTVAELLTDPDFRAIMDRYGC
ncbi:kinase-like domain-containing protein [Aspergillus pseudoustus]|uniref:Kinase-like domain-containing protein n=1 Tax=Aspergillus pseudoustus TaxID=1810923 RepID=A0ABR4KYL0_9EURO